MAAAEGVVAAIDQVLAYFNARRMDLPDGLFDRRTQFVTNGVPFEATLSTAPNDPLILMLARGPAGFRFAAKALQHAMPDALLERGDVVTDGDPYSIALQVWLSGTLRGSSESLNTVVDVSLRLGAAGPIDVAEARLDPATLEKIREARVRP